MKIVSTSLGLVLLTACSAQTTEEAALSDEALLALDEPMVHYDHEAGEPMVSMAISGDTRCITSNGVPEHQVGTWRPGAVVVPQEHEFCVDATPELTDTITRGIRFTGMTVTGIPLRPGTAEYYDASSEKGWSRDRSSGWNLEGVGGLRMDNQNAHVDGDGIYHYHGIPPFVVGNLEGTLFAYAADGFEIHYMGEEEQSSWQLRKGERESGPGGAFDGTYVQDYEYVEGSGTLDECNGAMRDERYTYFATNTYPFFPRCFKGTVLEELRAGGGGGDRPERDGERPPR